MIVHMIGNAHIDPVWLWNWPAGVDEALASFRSAADRCDEYPDFRYTRGEAWLYRQVERLDPDLFARIQKLVAGGQWHVTGGQVVQPDCNLPTGGGWHRQLKHGQRYFRERFGVRPTVGYNVDSFGHPVTLPDLYVQHGYLGYVFGRPNAAQQALPAQTFRWRGVAGGELIGFRITPAYVTRSNDLYGQIMLAVEAADERLGHTMCFYGVGNHGGGPTKANIEYILANQHTFGGLELRFSTPEAFFRAVKRTHNTLPVFEGELQSTFPGCYSAMHDVKQAQRQGEHLLDQAEAFIENFGEAERREVQHQRLDAAWNDLLFTQFHDILSGTSIPSAWSSVRAMQGRARIVGEELVVETSRRHSRALPDYPQQQIAALNASPHLWKGWLEAEPFLDFDAWGERWLSLPDGTPVPHQRVQPEGTVLLSNRILFPATVPAAGAAQFLVRDDVKPAETNETDLAVSETKLSNAHLRLELSPASIRQLTYRGAALLGEGGIGLHLRDDSSDTWTFHSDRFDEPVSETFSGEGWVVEETGPLRARARLEGRLGHSTVRWTVSLYRGEPRVHLALEVNFSERFKLLQLPIHLRQQPERWTDAQAGGHVTRQPSPTEWPVQSWSRLEFVDLALALLTHDAYSLSLHGRCWQWTLLRSPLMAWGGDKPDVYAGRTYHTDQGPHRFEFVLEVGQTITTDLLHSRATRLAQPPVIFDRYEGMQRPPWGNDVPRRLWTGAEQRARRDGRMMHLQDDAEKGVEE